MAKEAKTRRAEKTGRRHKVELKDLPVKKGTKEADVKGGCWPIKHTLPS